LRETPGDNNAEGMNAIFFFLSQQQYFFDRFFLGGVDECAGINDDNISQLTPVNELQAGLTEQSAHYFRVD
jgi:hypothetical protein